MSNTYSVAMTCSFMATGMSDGGKLYDIYRAWEHGAIELHGTLVEYAEFNNQLFEVIEQLTDGTDHDSCPSVWEYEVSEPFGKWFAERVLANDVPEKQEGQEKMIEIACLMWMEGRPAGQILKLIKDVTSKMKTPAQTDQTEQISVNKEQEALRDELSAAVSRLYAIEGKFANQALQITALRSDLNCQADVQAKKNTTFTEAIANADTRYENLYHGFGGHRLDMLDRVGKLERLTDDVVVQQVKKATTEHMEKVTGYIDKRVDRQVREAFQKARDAL